MSSDRSKVSVADRESLYKYSSKYGNIKKYMLLVTLGAVVPPPRGLIAPVLGSNIDNKIIIHTKSSTFLVP